MNYFVTVDGVKLNYNLTKEEAIKLGKKEYEKNPNVGIGRYKRWSCKREYSLLPLSFYV